jgi:hypothetical protein
MVAMLQQVKISTPNARNLKPLLRSAMEREVKLLQHSIQRTKQALAVYENRYQMSSVEFERKFHAKEIEETLDYLDWWMELEALHHLEVQYQSLSEAKVE